MTSDFPVFKSYIMTAGAFRRPYLCSSPKHREYQLYFFTVIFPSGRLLSYTCP